MLSEYVEYCKEDGKHYVRFSAESSDWHEVEDIYAFSSRFWEACEKEVKRRQGTTITCSSEIERVAFYDALI